MRRIDDATIPNPFGWRLTALTDHGTDVTRRARLLDELLVCEAEELANGYRHLTITHGDPTDIEASRRLSCLYETIATAAAQLGWVRVRGDAAFVTITVHGPDADMHVDQFRALAYAANPGGGWTVTDSPAPDASGR